MKKIYMIIPGILVLLCMACTSDPEAEKTDQVIEETIIENAETEEPENIEEANILYFENVFSSFEYPGRKVSDIDPEKFKKEEDHIPFEGMFFGVPVSGKMHFDESKEEQVIEYITFTVYEDDLSQYDCQEYLYNTYGALIAEGTEEDADGQIYWRRYFTGQKLLKYSKKAKEDFYNITVE